ncbi:MAG: hypothetical protein KBS59_06975, partial [Clostridiales bacterium]|nr:hypothetical protein [Clostridiales bacterium]
MGFGWMFLGGLFFCTGKAGSFDLLPDFIGYLLLIKGMNTAGKYCRDFDGVKKLGALGEAVSAVLFIMQGLDMLGSNGVFSPG